MFTGHPKGLFRLFFIEMWERLAFYTMVGMLLLYAIDSETGGLGLSRLDANEIYGLYLAFVYFTPYIGGMIADRFLGYRKAVLLGGVCFATGFFMLGSGQSWGFSGGLGMLCLGNGFFKPNISVMVGNLYDAKDPKRDAGFNVFYMGINIGAFIANLMAAALRIEFGWLTVFQGAGVGMLIGISILLWSWNVLAVADRQPPRSDDDASFGDILLKILMPAFTVGITVWWAAGAFLPQSVQELVKPTDIGFLAGMIPIIIFFVRLGTTANEKEKPGLLALLPIYIAGGTFFMILHLNGSAMTAWALDNTNREVMASVTPGIFKEDALPSYYKNAGPELKRPNRLSLLPVEGEKTVKMFGQQRLDAAALELIKTANPSIRVETLWLPGQKEDDAAKKSEEETARLAALDKRGCDVFAQVDVTEEADSHGVMQISVKVPDGVKRTQRVVFVREVEGKQIPQFLVTQSTFDMLYKEYKEKHGAEPEQVPPGEYVQLIQPVLFQSWNALFVICFTPLVVFFMGWLMTRGTDFSTARKIFVGMVMTAASLVFMAMAGVVGGDGAMKVSPMWLVGFYAIITIGELFLSPMALSLVTKLSPARFVGLTMGGWFLATAFGNKFSGFFGSVQGMMTPTYFFLLLAALVSCVAAFIYFLLPRLDKAIKQYGA